MIVKHDFDALADVIACRYTAVHVVLLKSLSQWLVALFKGILWWYLEFNGFKIIRPKGNIIKPIHSSHACENRNLGVGTRQIYEKFTILQRIFYFIFISFYFILFYLFNSLAFVISRINNIGEYYSNVKINLIPWTVWDSVAK
jgi:hypothetical protein